MGYTHSWRWKSPLVNTERDVEKFARWSQDARTLLGYYPDLQPYWPFLQWYDLPETWDITIRGSSGSGEPVFGKERVIFNGDRETGNAHEDFAIELTDLYQAKFWSWCKTGHDPYDLLVIAALVRFAHYFPTVALWSDGEESGLDAGAKLCSKAFGVGINPLRDPEYRKYIGVVRESWEEEE